MAGLTSRPMMLASLLIAVFPCARAAAAPAGSAESVRAAAAEVQRQIDILSSLRTTPAEKIKACEALKKKGKDAAFAAPVLVRTLARPGGVRDHAGAALRAIGPAAIHPLVGSIYSRGEERAAAADLLGRLGEAVKPEFPALIKLLDESDDGPTRDLVCGIFEGLGPTAMPAAPALRRALRHPVKATRWSAIEALVSVDQSASPEVLEAIAYLDHPVAPARADAIDVLRKAGTKANEALPDVAALLWDRNIDVRAKAAEAIPALGPPRRDAVEQIVRRLNITEEGLRSRMSPAEWSAYRRKLLGLLAMAGADPEPAESILLGEMQSDITGDDAAAVLCEMGPRAAPLAPQIIRMLDSTQQVRRRTVRVLGAIAPSDESDATLTAIQFALINALSHEDVLTRNGAAESLAGLVHVPKRAVTPLMEMLKQSDIGSVSAARALEKVGPEAGSAIPVLLDLLKKAERHDDADDEVGRSRRAAFAAAVGNIAPNSAEAGEMLINAVKTQDWVVREALAPMLAKRHDKETTLVPALRELSERDPTELVRVNARCALRELRNAPTEKK